MLKNWPLKLLTIAIFVVICAIGYKSWNIHEAKNDIFSETQFGEFEGPADAPIQLVEFLDYRCSACRTKHEDIKKLLENNKDLKVIYRHYPVFGPQAADEAAIALAAGMQGKFLEVHNRLISRETPLTPDEMKLMIHELNLDRGKFMKDFRGRETGIQLIKNMDNAQMLGINSTPTFFINKKHITTGTRKMPPLDMLQKAVDDARKDL